MKIVREATPEEIEKIIEALSKRGYGKGGKHSDRCTSALCVCGQGENDGTPMPDDYKKAKQPLPGFGERINHGAVDRIIKKRMKNKTQINDAIKPYGGPLD